LEYLESVSPHQALGLVPLPELEQRALSLRRQQGLHQVQVTCTRGRHCITVSLQRLLPLRTVYTSLFSSGLHLQNSLLKVFTASWW
jgi:hypothetical protein